MNAINNGSYNMINNINATESIALNLNPSPSQTLFNSSGSSIDVPPSPPGYPGSPQTFLFNLPLIFVDTFISIAELAEQISKTDFSSPLKFLSGKVQDTFNGIFHSASPLDPKAIAQESIRYGNVGSAEPHHVCMMRGQVARPSKAQLAQMFSTLGIPACRSQGTPGDELLLSPEEQALFAAKAPSASSSSSSTPTPYGLTPNPEAKRRSKEIKRLSGLYGFGLPEEEAGPALEITPTPEETNTTETPLAQAATTSEKDAELIMARAKTMKHLIQSFGKNTLGQNSLKIIADSIAQGKLEITNEFGFKEDKEPAEVRKSLIINGGIPTEAFEEFYAAALTLGFDFNNLQELRGLCLTFVQNDKLDLFKEIFNLNVKLSEAGESTSSLSLEEKNALERFYNDFYYQILLNDVLAYYTLEIQAGRTISESKVLKYLQSQPKTLTSFLKLNVLEEQTQTALQQKAQTEEDIKKCELEHATRLTLTKSAREKKIGESDKQRDERIQTMIETMGQTHRKELKSHKDSYKKFLMGLFGIKDEKWKIPTHLALALGDKKLV